jgi:meso-butanediol dehydrogenase / (S,S)-butanediol dehydrogenase / diacetyl reductase
MVNLAAYCRSKFGLLGLAQSLAMELAHAGITVHAICPGGVDAERMDYLGERPDGTYDDPKRRPEIARHAAAIPLDCLTSPQDVPALAASLAFNAAAYIAA